MGTSRNDVLTSTKPIRPLRIAMMGTRGVPARYGGFETAVEEIGSRLAERGHEVIVYCRGPKSAIPKQYRGMKLIRLPALHFKSAETLSHTGLSVAHVTSRRRPDVAFVFNSANAPFLPLLRARKIPTVVHVDGLEWKRDKWDGAGRQFYRWAEGTAVRWGDALISDAEGIADYYTSEFSMKTEVISYGAPILRDAKTDRLAEFGLKPAEYHLVVARFEPENHVDVIVDGYRQSSASHPLIVVGAAPYAAAYTQRIQQMAASDPRVKLLGAVYDQEALDQFYANALTYLHGHSVGGTNPSLLRAMGAGTAVIAWNVGFNQEVAGPRADYFSTPAELAKIVVAREFDLQMTLADGLALQSRAEQNYDWDAVAESYEELAARVSGGYSTAGEGTRRGEATVGTSVAVMVE